MAGQAAARARGKTWGPARTLPAHLEAKLVRTYLAGGYTYHTVGDLFGVTHSVAKSAIYRVVRPDAPYLSRRRPCR